MKLILDFWKVIRIYSINEVLLQMRKLSYKKNNEIVIVETGNWLFFPLKLNNTVDETKQAGTKLYVKSFYCFHYFKI